MYSNYEKVSGRYNPNQYEAAANGLLLWKIEHEGLSRNDRYVDVHLFESEEKEGGVIKLVWYAAEYTPISVEVK